MRPAPEVFFGSRTVRSASLVAEWPSSGRSPGRSAWRALVTVPSLHFFTARQLTTAAGHPGRFPGFTGGRGEQSGERMGRARARPGWITDFSLETRYRVFSFTITAWLWDTLDKPGFRSLRLGVNRARRYTPKARRKAGLFLAGAYYVAYATISYRPLPILYQVKAMLAPWPKSTVARPSRPV